MDARDDLRGQPLMAGHDVTRTSTSFVPEILQMMQSFGDGPKCNPGSAHLIEELVRTQMNSSLIQCLEIAASKRRGEEVEVSKAGLTIGLLEVLFLMRKDVVKSVRLLRHLNLKDCLSSTSSSSSSANCTNFDTSLFNVSSAGEEASWTMAVQSLSTVPSANSGNFLLDGSDLTSIELQASANKKRNKLSRIDTCINILTQIDDTNAVLDVYNDDDYIDQIKLNRNIRIEAMTRNMSDDEYLKFTQSRSVSFSNKSKLQKFKQWLMNETESILGTAVLNIDPYAMEALQWMAHETVAEAQKKKDKFDSVQGLISGKKNPLFTMATTVQGVVDGQACIDHGQGMSTIRGIKRKVSNQRPDASLLSDCNDPCLKYFGSISPADVREVARRHFNNPVGQGHAFNCFKRCS